MVGIYMFTNKINGKKYIGQSVDVERRYRTHLLEASKNSKKEFYADLNEVKSFTFEMLEECLIEELDSREKFWIEKYKTYTPYGYNLTKGGAGEVTYLQYDSVDRENITEDIIKNILTLEEISKKYNISIWSLYSIRSGRMWKRDNLTYPLRPKVGENLSVCSACGEPNSKGAELCKKCESKRQRVVERPSRELLLEKVALQGFSSVGREYGVSDNAVKKWCKAYGLPHLKRDAVNLYKKKTGV